MLLMECNDIIFFICIQPKIFRPFRFLRSHRKCFFYYINYLFPKVDTAFQNKIINITAYYPS